MKSQQGKSTRQIITISTIVSLVVVLLSIGVTWRMNQLQEEKSVTQAAISEPVYQPATSDEIFKLVNQERGKAGLQPLIRMNELDVSAQYKADDMANRNYLSHEDPETGKKNGVDKIFELTGLVCFYGSENYHYGTKQFKTSVSAINWWMNSPSHRDAILDPEYTYAGVGVVNKADGSSVQVQHFCKAR